MSLRVNLPETFADKLARQEDPLIGLWVCSANPLIAEIVASSGCDWVLVDGEHSPNSLESILAQLYAMSAYDASPVVRLPYGDTVLIKQYLDLGVQNLLIPMVDSGEQAAEIVKAVRYPLNGVRGVGSALARSARWNRVENYLHEAEKTISLTVQIESAEAVKNAREIIATDGVDAVFIGPSDLAASMGHLGQQNHPDVQKAVLETIKIANELGKPVGVNAFVKADADTYLKHGADYVAIGADVAILARQTENIVASFKGADPAGADPAGKGAGKGAGSAERASY